MIIDLILDRKDDDTVWNDRLGHSVPYDAHLFYLNVMDYGETGWNITRAMDNDNETQVKQALCEYIDNGKYNPEIKEYINNVNWL